MQRLYGRAPSNLRAYASVPHGHYMRVTTVSAIRLSCVFASDSFVGTMTGKRFQEWVVECLTPDLNKGDVVVMDNLRSHKDKVALEAIESVGARVLFLPPYSPDLNPIELVWSKTKAVLRGCAERSVARLPFAVAGAISCITAEDCIGFFKHCGYETQQPPGTTFVKMV